MNFYNSRTMKDSPAIAGFNVLPAPFVLCRSTLTLDHPHFSQALSKASRLEQLGLELSRRTLKSHCPTLSRLLSPMARFLWLAGQDNQGEIAFFAFCEDLVCPSYSDEVETSSKFNKKYCLINFQAKTDVLSYFADLSLLLKTCVFEVFLRKADFDMFFWCT